MTEQANSPEVELNKKEASNLSNIEFSDDYKTIQQHEKKKTQKPQKRTSQK